VSAPSPFRLATAGIGVVGVTFGMARYGYGLLLPDVRRAYGLGAGTLGLIGTGSYVGYLAAAFATGSLASRAGARATAATAGVLAAVGMVVAGLSRSPEVFAAGILLAGASAALSFAPISDAAAALASTPRARVLSAVNCATGYGVALAVPIAIAAGARWRTAWLVFAAFALLAAAWAARVLPGRGAAARPAYGWSGVLCRKAAPLLACGVMIGIGSSAYWTFAVAHLQDAGALSSSTSRTFLAVVGVAGVLATGTGELIRALGAGRAYALLAATETGGVALLAIAPTSIAAAFASAVMFGAAYSAAVGVQAIWSTQLFSARPSLGLSATMAANGAGLMLGPVAAGALAAPVGLGAVLLMGAAVVLASALLRPRHDILA
jgi:predicted MFS family arabinose efflux permease